MAEKLLRKLHVVRWHLFEQFFSFNFPSILWLGSTRQGIFWKIYYDIYPRYALQQLIICPKHTNTCKYQNFKQEAGLDSCEQCQLTSRLLSARLLLKARNSLGPPGSLLLLSLDNHIYDSFPSRIMNQFVIQYKPSNFSSQAASAISPPIIMIAFIPGWSWRSCSSTR